MRKEVFYRLIIDDMCIHRFNQIINVISYDFVGINNRLSDDHGTEK
jgi:hypothetical protein